MPCRIAFRSLIDLPMLTYLHTARPAGLANAHDFLDAGVAAACGWPTDLSDDEILKRLLDLNLARSAGG